MFSSHAIAFNYIKLVWKQIIKNYNCFLIDLEIVILALRSNYLTTFLIQVIHFITNLEGSYYSFEWSISVSHQNDQTSREIKKKLDISIFSGSFCCSFNLQNLVFVSVLSKTFFLSIPSKQLWCNMFTELGILRMELFMTTWSFISFFNPSHVTGKLLHERQTLGFRTFILELYWIFLSRLS